MERMQAHLNGECLNALDDEDDGVSFKVSQFGNALGMLRSTTFVTTKK